MVGGGGEEAVEGFEDEDEDSLDEDILIDLPICVQASLTQLMKKRDKLRAQGKSLKVQLRRAQDWCEELRIQVENLNAKLAVKNSKICQKCTKFKKQVKVLKLELKNKEVETQDGDSQTTEEDLRQAAWIFQYKQNTTPRISSTQQDESSLVDSIRDTAEQALLEQGMVLEETSGLYYDYKTGYYYDAEKALYYDGSTGTYFKYNQDTKEYLVDSMLPEEEVAAQKELKLREEEKKLHRIRKRRRSSDKERDPSRVEDVREGRMHDEYSDDDIQESDIPCVRLVVKNTEDERVHLGSLYIITCKGGSIGSKGLHEVLLPDLGCSKLHAQVSFKSSDCSYYLKDLGSRNGTWINGKRLSKPKEESKLIQIGHGTCIQIGKTKLICHVHPGTETCLECEPGLVRAELRSENGHGGAGKEELRKKELKDLKRKYGIGVGLSEEREEIPGFIDRAEERRLIHGVDPINAKTETASIDQAIGGKNKGFKMLEKMGWEGGGLGRSKDGIQEPIQVQQRANKSGLGTDIPVESISARDKKRNEIWKKTQKRFQKTPVLDVFKISESDDEQEES
ncbi:angiogenic factor with G patch and FHA domains 1 [Eurytemora carolleeae]|uniref:angiogenic factor with G patch and FHA domains 1 n=1 Tax=Eurytemora carolleeae TaxID=1294199 RepID=UPI000C7634E5|nr:angiogenic factor with G patch and FHA domains 1 [Eurytemora carolleeae]|eukprot:XP_023330858.1 angiogenic factor with G patch and FHA domains 1-like [Eurytemora affinis]